MSKNIKKKAIPKGRSEPMLEKILEFNTAIGLMVVVSWVYPYDMSKSNYLAILIGEDPRYNFSRLFLQKNNITHKNKIHVGYNPRDFFDGMIIEEASTYKENHSKMTKRNLWQISVMEDSIWGEKIDESKAKNLVSLKQELLFSRFRDIISDYGQDFTLHTMISITEEYRKHKRPSKFFKQSNFFKS